MVIVKNLSYGSEGRILIYPFSLSLDDGSVTGVVGKSGAGKSLMLKLLAGETGGYDGAIEINGRELSAIPARERHKLLSYSRGDLPENGDEPVEDFLLSARIAHKKFLRPYGGADLQLTRDYMKIFELSAVRDRPLNTLTGSALARALMAHAFIVDPAVLLLDGVPSEMDPRDRRLLAGALSRFTLNGDRSVVLASNDLNLVFQTADSVLFVGDGKVSAPIEPGAIDAETIRRYFDEDALISRNIYNGRPQVHFFAE